MNKAYLAGIFDGEGSIWVGRTKVLKSPYKYKFQLFINITNSCRLLLEELQKEFGGTIKIAHDHPERNWKTVYVWYTASKKSETFLKSIYKYLIVKKERSRMAIEFQKIKRMRKTIKVVGSGVMRTKEQYKIESDYYERMKMINQRGIGKHIKKVKKYLSMKAKGKI